MRQNKTEQLNQLFSEWENLISEYQGKFIKDGIINEDEYALAPVKILYITKEANQWGKPSAGDFRDDWQNKFSDYPFAYRIAEWSFGILNDFPPFTKIYKAWPNYHDMLQKIAFMNIKKNGGVGNSHPGVILKHFNWNKDFILRQIEIIDPQLIILGLSDNFDVRNNLFKNVKWVESGYNVEIAKWEEKKIIDFYHPSSRNAPSAVYSLLQNIFYSKPFQNL